jgi:hypothetical protein
MVENTQKKQIPFISGLALVIAIAGVGLGAWPFLFPPEIQTTDENVITGMWSANGQEEFAVPVSSLTYIPNLLIDYTIAEGQNSYYHFDCVVEFTAPGLLQFVLWINDESYPQGFTSLKYPDLGGENVTLPVSFFYTLYEFTAGTHNVTVSVYSDSTATTLHFSRLLVQTFVE